MIAVYKNIRNTFFLGLFILGINSSLYSQDTPIATDRPDQTESPFIVPKHFLQLENGFLIENLYSGSKSYTHPSTLWRYGVNERFEFRLITEFVSVKDGNTTLRGLSPITVGFKVNLIQENGIIPVTSFIGHLVTSSVGSKAFKTSYTATTFRFLMQNTLSDKVSLAYNVGAEWDGESAEPTFIYTLSTSIALSNKLGTFIEVYGYLPEIAESRHNADLGFTYLITDHLLADVSAGIGLTKNDLKNFLSAGISYRFKTH